MLILGFDLNLVVPRKTIHKIKYLTTHTFIDNMVNEWDWKIIFWASFFQITKFHTHTDHTLIFVERSRVRHSFRQLHWIDEANLNEFLYLILDRRCLARIDWEKLLSDRHSIGVSYNLVFNYTWVNA